MHDKITRKRMVRPGRERSTGRGKGRIADNGSKNRERNGKGATGRMHTAGQRLRASRRAARPNTPGRQQILEW